MRTRGAVCYALVVALAGCAGVPRTGSAVTRDATTPAGGPSVAPTPPGASPREVEDAKTTAKAAELTPIVPSPQNPLHPAFQLYAEIDLPVLGIGLVFAGARLVRTQPSYCGSLCSDGERRKLNALDRTTAGYWSPGWTNASDYVLIALGAGSASLLMLDEGVLPGLNDSLVIAESALAGIAVSSMMTLATGRPRPFVYGEKAPLSARTSADSGMSFLSSHAVASFAIATSTFVTMRRLHPRSRVAWIVAGVGGAMATFVATARVLGGMHFISDSVGGAIVGTSLGMIVPSLHGSPVAVVPVVGGGGQRGVALSARF
jgi:membrane-associated phospholipid phosphatase